MGYQASFFENFALNQATNSAFDSAGRLMMQAVYVPGSISFNNVNVIVQASGTTAKTLTISFGLYSLNGSTLSLANSASKSSNFTTNATSFISLITSAAQNITPGIWYFAYISSTSSNGSMSFIVNNPQVGVEASVGYGGPFFRGHFSTTTNAFPASIATSNMSKEGVSNNLGLYVYPYTIISA